MKSNTCDLLYDVFEMKMFSFVVYRSILKVSASVTFEFSSQKGPLFSGSRYFRMVKNL